MTMEEGKIVEWTKKEKEWIKKGEIFLVIESDKVTYEVESPGSGILHIIVETGEGIKVGVLLAVLAESEEEYSKLCKDFISSPKLLEAIEVSQVVLRETSEKEESIPSPINEILIRATPGARKLAKQKGIELAKIIGSGPEGRITREDVLKASEGAPANSKGPAIPIASQSMVDFGPKKLLKEEFLSSMRTTISRRMMQSLQTSAQMTAFSEWDVTQLMRLRNLINKSEEKFGFHATIPGLMVAIVARVLKEMPIFNASVEGNVIKYWVDVNIGVAVALPDGLVVPVIHGADKKSLYEIHKNLEDLIKRARQKKLLTDDMSYGTFTLTNLGSYGGEWETIIINPPEVAILGIGQITERPLVHESRIVFRQMMPISMTVDHRIIDGATSGKFRQRMKNLIENPGLFWVELNI